MSEAFKDPALPPAIDLPDGPAWTELLTALSPETGETLTSLIFTLCPHNELPVRVYRRVVLTFDRMAAETADVRYLIEETVAGLDDGVLPFRDRAESYRVADLKAIETAPGFILIQRLTVRYLYDDLEVWRAFGYEGASTHLGGYVARGFDDLDWLPPLPPEITDGSAV